MLYLFLPAYSAGLAPILAKKTHILPLLDKPVDGGKVLLNKPVLGCNKTIRGFVVAILVGFYVSLLQIAWSPLVPNSLKVVQYDSAFLVVGVLMGVGSIFGDALGSFIKRRLGYKEGALWFPFDYLDYTFGAMLFACLFADFSITIKIMALVLNPFLTISSNYLLVKLGIKEAL